MKKILIVFFCFVSVSVFGQQDKFTILTDDVTDIRYKLWFNAASPMLTVFLLPLCWKIRF